MPGLEMGVVKVVGMDQLLKQVSALGTSVEKRVSHELQATSQDIVRKAKRYAPVDFGFLRRGVDYIKHDDLSYSVVSTQRYSAYVDFGTGKRVDLAGYRQDIVSYAATFKIAKRPHPGRNSHRFFFKAFLQEEPILIQRVQHIINNP